MLIPNDKDILKIPIVKQEIKIGSINAQDLLCVIFLAKKIFKSQRFP